MWVGSETNTADVSRAAFISAATARSDSSVLCASFSPKIAPAGTSWSIA